MRVLVSETRLFQALNEIDLEAKRINEHLLENAKAKRLEQEDEIKHLNELILNAKVKLAFSLLSPKRQKISATQSATRKSWNET